MKNYSFCACVTNCAGVKSDYMKSNLIQIRDEAAGAVVRAACADLGMKSAGAVASLLIRLGYDTPEYQAMKGRLKAQGGVDVTRT